MPLEQLMNSDILPNLLPTVTHDSFHKERNDGKWSSKLNITLQIYTHLSARALKQSSGDLVDF